MARKLSKLDIQSLLEQKLQDEAQEARERARKTIEKNQISSKNPKENEKK